MGKTFGRIEIKRGMKGSSAGRGRSGSTAELKSYSKTARRRQGKHLPEKREEDDVTLQELLAIDEGGDCPGCPVCEPPKTRSGSPRSVSFPVRSNRATFSVRYADARSDPTAEQGVIATAFFEA